MKRISTAWQLTKESFRILMKDKEMLWFPVFSGICNLILLAGLILTYLIPMFNSGGSNVEINSPSNFIILFAYYLFAFFIISFFDTAVITCASIRLNGGDPTVMDGLRKAFKYAGKIFLWSIIGATVGIILNTLEKRSKTIGRVLIGIFGMMWSLITCFVIPVLIFEDKKVLTSIKRSGSIFKKTWGETVTVQASMGIIIIIAFFAGFIPLALSLPIKNTTLLLITTLYAFIHIIAVVIISSTLVRIYVAALYHYATTGKVSKEYSELLIRNAYAAKG